MENVLSEKVRDFLMEKLAEERYIDVEKETIL